MKEETDNIITVILAGGKGTRLFPLTKNHSKPAVPYGGRYRLIDIPISNSINSDIKNIFVLAQYLTTELEFHLQNTYQFDHFSKAAIHFISPQETADGSKIWFDGTADAVRKSLSTLLKTSAEYFLILSGDQLYNVDFNKMFSYAKEKNANLTVAALKVDKQEAPRLGILKTNTNNFITDFIEKPQDPSLLENYKLNGSDKYLASMGIYIFKREALISLLEEDKRDDFGQHLIPTEMKKGKTAAFIYDGYWEDIGTISSYYEANLALTDQSFDLDIYNEKKPIFTRPCYLPGPMINHTSIDRSILCDGSIIFADKIENSIIGIRSHIKRGSIIKDSILVGNHISFLGKRGTSYESCEIGENCLIEKTIIDEHVFIGNNVKLINKNKLDTYDGEGIYIRDGIIVIAANTIIPDNYVL